MYIDTPLEQFWQNFLQSHPHLKATGYYEAFAFGNTKQMANELATLVVSGVKTAISSLLWTTEQQEISLICERFRVV